MVDFSYAFSDSAEDRRETAELFRVVERLRAPGGCPWDREQTHESLRAGLLEESHEVIDAINRGDDAALCEELGDVLLQIVFHTLLAEERGAFRFEDVLRVICDKLVLRHPHVFGSVTVDGTEQVLRNWEAIKQSEKEFSTRAEALQAVPASFPALLRADKLLSRAGKAGYDPYPGIEPLSGAEAGDKLVETVAAIRAASGDAELLLHEASQAFIERFSQWEREQTAKTPCEGAH